MNDDIKETMDILQIKDELMKKAIISEINNISLKDAVEFTTVWQKEPESDIFQKSVFIEIYKGGFKQ